METWKVKKKKVVQEEKPQPQNNNNFYINLFYEASVDKLKNWMMDERAKHLIMSFMPSYNWSNINAVSQFNLVSMIIMVITRRRTKVSVKTKFHEICY